MSGATTTQPRLIFHPAQPSGRDPNAPTRPPGPAPSAALSPTDPRWVLALRTHEVLDGDRIGPAMRQRLIRLGRMMGLTAFEANLVIAIVQDGARRGLTLGDAEASLLCVPRQPRAARRMRWRVAAWVASFLMIEAAALIFLLG
jgi:hypothetical protein